MRLSKPIGLALALLPVLAMLPLLTAHSESAVQIAPPAIDSPPGDKLETAVLAGGCFWGIQAVYQHTKGVTNAVSGYAGGSKEDGELLHGRLRPHRPRRGGAGDVRSARRSPTARSCRFSSRSRTTRRSSTGRGRTRAPQYRSEIFPQNDAQRKVATAYIAQLDAAKIFPQADRDQDGDRQGGVLSGGGLSPGLRHDPPDAALHRLQRPAEGREPQDSCSRTSIARSRCWWRRRRLETKTFPRTSARPAGLRSGAPC